MSRQGWPWRHAHQLFRQVAARVPAVPARLCRPAPLTGWQGCQRVREPARGAAGASGTPERAMPDGAAGEDQLFGQAGGETVTHCFQREAIGGDQDLLDADSARHFLLRDESRSCLLRLPFLCFGHSAPLSQHSSDSAAPPEGHGSNGIITSTTSKDKLRTCLLADFTADSVNRAKHEPRVNRAKHEPRWEPILPCRLIANCRRGPFVVRSNWKHTRDWL